MRYKRILNNVCNGSDGPLKDGDDSENRMIMQKKCVRTWSSKHQSSSSWSSNWRPSNHLKDGELYHPRMLDAIRGLFIYLPVENGPFHLKAAQIYRSGWAQGSWLTLLGASWRWASSCLSWRRIMWLHQVSSSAIGFRVRTSQGEAAIVEENILASDGVIHVIDALLWIWCTTNKW